MAGNSLVVNRLRLMSPNFVKSPVHMQEELKHYRNSVKRQWKTANKYLNKSSLQLEKCLAHEKVLHEAELIQANLFRLKKGETQLNASDWLQEGKEVQLHLNPRLKPHEEVAQRFKLAKKLKTGLPFAKKEVEQAEGRLREITALKEALEKVETEEQLEPLRHFFKEKQAPQDKREKAPPKPYYEFSIGDSASALVGKNAKGNDALTFTIANGNDLWAHATGVPGSHVVIKPAKGKDLNEAALQEGLKLALYYSKARAAAEGEVSLTKVKHVKKAGRTAGKVQIANEKRYFIRLDRHYRPQGR